MKVDSLCHNFIVEKGEVSRWYGLNRSHNLHSKVVVVGSMHNRVVLNHILGHYTRLYYELSNLSDALMFLSYFLAQLWEFSGDFKYAAILNSVFC